MKLTNDAKSHIHYLLMLNYKLALHVLAAVKSGDEQVDANTVMGIGHRLLVRTANDEEYAKFISVDSDEQLRWARKHASHKHNLELTIARAIRLTLEKSLLSESTVVMCEGAVSFIEGQNVRDQVTEMIWEAANRTRSFQMVINTTKHLHVARVKPTEGEAQPLPATSPVKKVY